MDINIQNENEKKDSILSRVWKFKFHYLVIIPAIVFIIFTKLVPIIMCIKLPFVAYNPAKGIQNSKWVGLQNFIDLFSKKNFFNVINNTVLLNIGFVLICAVLSFIIIMGLSGINSKIIVVFFTTLFLVPLFIPSIVYSYFIYYLVINIFANASILTNPYFVSIMYMVAQTLKHCGIPIILGIAAINNRIKAINYEFSEDSKPVVNFKKDKVLPALNVILAFSIIQLSLILTNDFEMISTLYNPRVYKTMDVLDTMAYRLGILQFGFSMSAAAYLIKFVIQLVFVVEAYLLLRKFFTKDLFIFDNNPKIIEYNKKSNWFGIIPVMIYSGVVLGFLYIIFVLPFVTKVSRGGTLSYILNVIPGAGFKYVIATLIAVLINAFITLTLAYPLTVKELPGRRLYKAFLIVSMSIGTTTINEYLFYKGLGLTNTFLPYIMSGAINIASIFVLKSIFNSKYKDLKVNTALEGQSEGKMFFTLFIPKVWKPLIALCVLQFASIWNSYYTTMIFTIKRANFSLIMLFRETMVMIGDKSLSEIVPAVMRLGALISIVPVGLFLLFRYFFNSETFVGYI